VAESPEFEQEFQTLSAELRKLEGEYNMYFAGRTARPPLEQRGRVDQLFKRWDRKPIDTAASRFRLQTLQSRYSSFVDLWDRALRAREEGRKSPLFRTRDVGAPPPPPPQPQSEAQSQPVAEEPPIPAGPRAVTFTDPRAESDKLQSLYDQLMAARQQAGQPAVPFHKFADLVKDQTTRLKKKGSEEVTFSVTTTDGRVNLTAKGSKQSG
jgi:hypothetical protein